ncbi:P2Y purinoceptor 8-like [Emys orbicularis]|uniref:P2Y purinoceptor 8-like n=1 Tax=Emys orbicularis TaxID=82168 RepID=UPI0031FD467B
MGKLPNSTIEMLKNQMLQTTLPALYLFIFTISIPLNSISLWFLCRHSRPWTPTIVFSINLTITDLLYSMLLPFQVVYHLRGNDWPFGQVLCRIITVLFYANMHCSVLTMTSICLERYLGIVHPLTHRTMRPIRTALLTCVLIWIFVLLLHLPLMKTELTFQVEELQITTCFDILPKAMFPSRNHFIAYFGSQVLLCFLLPLLIMAFCYTLVIRTLLNSPPTQLREIKKQTMYLIIVLLIVFVVCYVPNIVISIIHFVYTTQNKTAYVEYKLSLALNSLNCCFDPLVYFFGSKEFRQKIQKKLCKCMPDIFSDMVNTFSEQDVPITSREHAPNN